jgi:uncharacterized membrane protein
VTAGRAGQVLLGGVLISAASLMAGLVTWMIAAPNGRALMDAGLVVLMATPVLRVVLSFAEYARERDWVFAAAAAAVLAILMASVIYSRST